MSEPLRVAVAPNDAPDWVRDAVRDGGGEVVGVERAEALLWFDYRYPEVLSGLVAAAPELRWVHLLSAGVDVFREVLDEAHLWTCGKGLSAEPLAEHALALALAGRRRLHEYVGAQRWGRPGGRSLYDQPVTILGAGGIATELIAHLAPFRCDVTVVRRVPDPVPGASRVLPVEALHDALPGAQVVFLALALTPQTDGIIGGAELALMHERAWLVNVARGRHVDTDALVEALEVGRIAGAALDVTDPEPLPPGHPLWSLPNCIVTPHTATTISMFRGALAGRVRENVARFSAGAPLLGTIDVGADY
jgi:phosphoglycerate dehydrogenase-like enzyme